MSIIICGSVNGDLRIKRDAYCRCAERRFRIAVENNREGGGRAAWVAWSHALFSRRKRDRAGSGLRQSQRKRVTGLSRKRSRLAELWPPDPAAFAGGRDR